MTNNVDEAGTFGSFNTINRTGLGGHKSTNLEVTEPEATVGRQGAPHSYLGRPFPARLRQMTVSLVAFNFLTFAPLSGFATSPHSDQS